MRKIKPYDTIDQYIAEFPENVQKLLQKMRTTIHAAAPDATEAISYGIPTFKLNGNLVHFGGFKNHIGFYPGAEAVEVFHKELSEFAGAKGSIRFPLDRKIPFDLVIKIVKFRVKKNT